MNSVLKLIPVCLYLIVGLISLSMAQKNIFSKKFLPFHEVAGGKSWDGVDAGLQSVILALMKVSGLGFLVSGLLLMIFPVIDYAYPNPVYRVGAPAIALLYCFGLFVVNYQLSVQTNASTPWKKSLYAVMLILVGMVISAVQ